MSSTEREISTAKTSSKYHQSLTSFSEHKASTDNILTNEQQCWRQKDKYQQSQGAHQQSHASYSKHKTLSENCISIKYQQKQLEDKYLHWK